MRLRIRWMYVHRPPVPGCYAESNLCAATTLNRVYNSPVMKFDELELIEPLLRAVRDEGYLEPTPIQEEAIPYVLDGKDLFGRAQTGTGKTAAFALPILQYLFENPVPKKPVPVRVLVLAPTRELVVQIYESFKIYAKYTKLRSTPVYGGVSQRPQAQMLHEGVEVLIATPGRLLDLMAQGIVRLNKLEILVLDEADRMLDMGFIKDIRRIVSNIPRNRQTLFFSATIPRDIKRLAGDILHDPVEVSVAPEYSTLETTEQYIYFVEQYDKLELLKHLLDKPEYTKVLVFISTKYGADKLERHLRRARVKADAIHGNKSQRQRENALDHFKQGRTQVLVATDVASRGIDIEEVSHVVNYDLPDDTENYIHRIGRTGRAGLSGIAIAFCDRNDRGNLVLIERLIRKHMLVIEDHPFKSFKAPPPPTDLESRFVRVSKPRARGRETLKPRRGKTEPFPTYGPKGDSGGKPWESSGPKRGAGKDRRSDNRGPRRRKPGDGKGPRGKKG